MLGVGDKAGGFWFGGDVVGMEIDKKGEQSNDLSGANTYTGVTTLVKEPERERIISDETSVIVDEAVLGVESMTKLVRLRVAILLSPKM